MNALWKRFSEITVTKFLRLAGCELTGMFRQSGTRVLTQAAPAAKTAGTTLTANEVLGGLITGNLGTAAAGNYQLPTAASLEAALRAQVKELKANDSIDFTLVNISTVALEDITITTNTGWTLVGNMTVASNDAATSQSQGVFRARRTAADTWTLYRIS